MSKFWTCTKCGFGWFSDLPVKPPADTGECACKNGKKSNWVADDVPHLSIIRK